MKTMETIGMRGDDQAANDNIDPSEWVLEVGCTWECPTVRVHRFADTVRVTELTHAGKRGKVCRELSVNGDVLESVALEYIGLANRGASWERLEEAASQHEAIGCRVYRETLKSIRVKPAGEKEIKIHGPHVAIEATPREFLVKCRVDQNNEPTLIAPQKRAATAVKRFYEWARTNEERLGTMRFRDVTRELGAAGIDYHYFCAMD